MTLLDTLLMVAGLAFASLAGWLANTWWTERRHECMPHDPATCRPEPVNTGLCERHYRERRADEERAP